MKPIGKKLLLLCGMAGAILLAATDWLMIYGDTAYEGALAWLTTGAAAIPPWRNSLAMALSFPAVILYALALLGLRQILVRPRQQKVYSVLTTLGMLPWLALHLFYILILFQFSWLTGQGEGALALAAGEAVFSHFVWLVPVSEVLMLLPFVYLFYVFLLKKTIYPRVMALNNPLLLYVILKLGTLVMPDLPFRLAFVNGLMSESMLVWFLLLFLLYPKDKEARK